MILYGTLSAGDRLTECKRQAKKGHDQLLKVELTNKGKLEYVIDYTPKGMIVWGAEGKLLETGQEGTTQTGK